MASARNESQLTAQIVKAVKSRFPEIWMLKVHGDGYQRAGVPDLIMCANGRFVGIEVKHRKPGESTQHMLGRVSALQREELRKITLAGGVAEVCWSVEQVIEILDALYSE